MTVAVSPKAGGAKRSGGEVISPVEAKKPKASFSPASPAPVQKSPASPEPVQKLPSASPAPVQKLPVSPAQVQKLPPASSAQVQKPNLTEAKKAYVQAPVKTAARQTKTPCDLCEKPCKSARGLTQHMNTSHKCGYCDGLFANLAEHAKNVHETEACSECEQKFITVASLENHMTRAHLVKCNICEENFYNEDALNEHTKEEHEEECEHCFERFLKSLSLLEPHQLMVHGIKPRVMKTFAGGMFMMV